MISSVASTPSSTSYAYVITKIWILQSSLTIPGFLVGLHHASTETGKFLSRLKFTLVHIYKTKNDIKLFSTSAEAWMTDKILKTLQNNL